MNIIEACSYAGKFGDRKSSYFAPAILLSRNALNTYKRFVSQRKRWIFMLFRRASLNWQVRLALKFKGFDEWQDWGWTL